MQRVVVDTSLLCLSRSRLEITAQARTPETLGRRESFKNSEMGRSQMILLKPNRKCALGKRMMGSWSGINLQIRLPTIVRAIRREKIKISNQKAFVWAISRSLQGWRQEVGTKANTSNHLQSLRSSLSKVKLRLILAELISKVIKRWYLNRMDWDLHYLPQGLSMVMRLSLDSTPKTRRFRSK